MHEAEQVRLLKELMAHLDAGTTVDAGGTRRIPQGSEGRGGGCVAIQRWELGRLEG